MNVPPYDNPRTPKTCTLPPRRFKHHQNSTRRPPRERRTLGVAMVLHPLRGMKCQQKKEPHNEQSLLSRVTKESLNQNGNVDCLHRTYETHLHQLNPLSVLEETQSGHQRLCWHCPPRHGRNRNIVGRRKNNFQPYSATPRRLCPPPNSQIQHLQHRNCVDSLHELRDTLHQMTSDFPDL